MPIFMLATILDSMPQPRACERECGPNSLTLMWAGNGVHRFARGRLTFLKKMDLAGPKIALRFLSLSVGPCFCTYHVCNTLLPCDTTLVDGCIEYWCSYNDCYVFKILKAEAMWTRRYKADQKRKCQTLAAAYSQLTDWKWLPGEPLNGLECSKAPAGFLDMRYQTCFKTLGWQILVFQCDSEFWSVFWTFILW